MCFVISCYWIELDHMSKGVNTINLTNHFWVTQKNLPYLTQVVFILNISALFSTSGLFSHSPGVLPYSTLFSTFGLLSSGAWFFLYFFFING